MKFHPQEKYADKQKAKDRVRVGVWVPEDRKKELIRYAAKLCREQSQTAAAG